MSIKTNIEKIREEIENSAIKAGRKPDEITLIAVSKTFPSEYVTEALKSGIIHFGENYVQDFISKFNELKEYHIKWHFIGHLQRNKVKYIFDKIYMLHTLDSIKLAEEINKKLKKADKTLNALIQVNIGNEESKSGIKVAECEMFIEKLRKFNTIQVSGLMTIPPYFPDSEKVRPYFRKMKELFEHLKKFNGDNINFKELSMGMSGDFKVAIEEGATMVRIGTSIFGERSCKYKLH